MKNIFITLIISALCLTGAAQNSPRNISILDRKVEKSGDSVVVSFRAEIGRKALSNGRTKILAPEINGGTNSWSLPAIAIRKNRAAVAAKRNDWKATVSGIGFDSNTIYTKPGITLNYRQAVAYQPWMEGANLVAEGIEMGCCSYERLDNVVLAQQISLMPEPVIEKPVITPPVQVITLTTGDKLAEKLSYIISSSEFETIEPGKLFDDDRENSLTIFFNQGKYGVDQAYKNNSQSLADLMNSIHMIENSTDSRVKGILIAGFASPEGGFELNDRLAWNRAVSAKEYIMQRSKIKSSDISIYNGSIDWRGLRMLVEKSDMYMKQQIIDIIDNTPIWDQAAKVGRHGKLMRLDSGRPYKYMYDNYFPLLRNAAYIKVYYENKLR